MPKVDSQALEYYKALETSIKNSVNELTEYIERYGDTEPQQAALTGLKEAHRNISLYVESLTDNQE